MRGQGANKKTIKEVKEARIKNIHLTLCFRENRVGVWTTDSVYIKGRDWAIRPENIYKTEKEAEEAIKGRRDIR